MTSTAEHDVAATIEKFLMSVDPPVEPIVDHDADLIDTGQMDSMLVVQLVEHIGQAYGITVPDEALNRENLETINAIARMVVDLGSAERALS